MASPIKIRTTIRDGIATVRCIIRHPMETGFRVDEANNELVPAHYIEQVFCYHNDELVLQCDWSRAVSKNPYLSFSFSGAQAGDRVRIHWIDNLGEENSGSIKIG
ncbi:MAG: thiosulfate oxidation carrier complex protein SoxZ [Gammaproteobacteria bacterium]|nr:thiosulfate oxidation carrier complex protein SoxZ [Gammaproteobacteria bacterium]